MSAVHEPVLALPRSRPLALGMHTLRPSSPSIRDMPGALPAPSHAHTRAHAQDPCHPAPSPALSHAAPPSPPSPSPSPSPTRPPSSPPPASLASASFRKAPSTTRISASRHVPGKGLDHAHPSPPVSRDNLHQAGDEPVPEPVPEPDAAPSAPVPIPHRATSATPVRAGVPVSSPTSPTGRRRTSVSASLSKSGGVLRRMMGKATSPTATTSASAHANAGASHAALSSPEDPVRQISGATGLTGTPVAQSPDHHHHHRGGVLRAPAGAPARSTAGAGAAATDKARGRLTAAALAKLEQPSDTAAGGGKKVPVPVPVPVRGESDSRSTATASTTLKDIMAGRISRRGSAAASASVPSPVPAPPASTTSSLRDKYGVCERAAIGRGATAVVRLAHKWDRSAGEEEKLYAVKQFRPRRKHESEKVYVKKLTSEFCISSTLHHVNVVETVDLVQDEQRHWCEVMEFCPGGDLYAAIKRGGMAQNEIQCYFKQVAHGVAYLHAMGVAHRDIKPENLLLDASGRVKITDFGVSDVFRMCWETATHYSKGLCGSEPYIAPEQFEQKEYDARLVDVWAIGIVFYCLQMQELPWRRAVMADPRFSQFVFAYHSSPAPGPLVDLVPEGARTLVKRMLCPDPLQRYGIKEVMADPWFASVDACGSVLCDTHTHSVILTAVAP